jgi:serine/threonine protein kinase
VLGGRYIVGPFLGKGTYSKVCIGQRPSAAAAADVFPNQETGKRIAAALPPAPSTVALKIFRGEERYTDAAQDEVRVLTALMLADPTGSEHGFMPYVEAHVDPPLEESASVATLPNRSADSNATGVASRAQQPENDRNATSPTKHHQERRDRHHAIIVYPLMGPCLLDVLRWGERDRRHVPMEHVRSIAFQLLKCVAYVHSRGVVHTDIKPENILFESRDVVGRDPPPVTGSSSSSSSGSSPSNSDENDDGNHDGPHRYLPRFPSHNRIRLVDFGSAIFRCKDLSSEAAEALKRDVLSRCRGTPEAASSPSDAMDATLAKHFMRHESGPRSIQTRHYRAPEVVFGCPWSFPADVWSVGCVLYEVYTGECLFMTHEDMEHLAMMGRALGPPVPPIAAAGVGGAAPTITSFRDVFPGGRYLDRFLWPVGMPPVPPVPGASCLDLGYPNDETKESSMRHVRDVEPLRKLSKHHAHFADLISRLLAWRPNERLTAAAALHHAFFKQE